MVSLLAPSPADLIPPVAAINFTFSFDKLSRQRHQPTFDSFRPALFDLNVPIVCVTLLVQTVVKGGDKLANGFW